MLDPEIAHALRRIGEMLTQRGETYAAADPFASMKATAKTMGVEGWVVAQNMVAVKAGRLAVALDSPALNPASVDDSLVDQACYAVSALVMWWDAL